jgi:muramoyltetrapeptide carboxypeptidase
MISYFGREENPLSDRYFIRMLTDSAPAGKSTFPESEVLKPGVAEGRLAGGCLSLVCHSLGTPFEIRTDKRILFLEDVNEAPYRIDRMLTQLRLAGKLDRVAGILFGEFLNCEPPPGTGYSLKDVLADCLREYKMPVLSGLPFGHGQKNITLPFGLRVRMDTSSKSIHFLESPVTGNCYPTDFRFGE